MSEFWCSINSSRIHVASIYIYQYHGFKCHDGVPFMTASSVHFGVHVVLDMTVLSVHFGNIEE